MSADYVYKGIPIEKDGVVHHVQPVRSIQAPNGKHYRGVLAVDSKGNEFVYRQYPNITEPPPAPAFLAMNEDTEYLSMNPDTGKLVLVSK